MNKKILISTIIFCLFTVFDLHAQITKIYGKVQNADGYLIELKKPTDYLSMHEQKASEDLIQEGGAFSMEIELKSTQLFFINIGLQKTEIYLEPSKSYEIFIQYDPQKEQISYVNKAYLEYEILNSDADELNNQIGLFNYKVNQFLISNFNQIYKRRNRNIISQFNAEIKSEFKNSSSFLKNYIDFRLASIDQTSGSKSRSEIYESYFQEEEVFFENDEAMRFFHQSFEKYLMKPNPYFELPQLMNEIFGKADLELVFSAFNNDPLLQSRLLKELALLKSLQELYFIPSVNKKNVLALMGKIGQKSIFPKIKNIAFNLVQELSYLRAGEQFPNDYLAEFDLIDRMKNSDSTEVFLHFFTIPCADCVSEMDSISNIHKKYSKDVRFISVALNAKENQIDKLKKDKKYSWEIIVASQPFKLAATYRINSLPAYFLIDSNNEVVLNAALEPWRGFSSFFKSRFKH
jgi:thiol-disulfide isomerase/thioredoxin